MAHSDIAQVGSMTNKSTLIGLGESSHGTHEFFVNKFEIFKQLVIKHGFNTMLFEDNQEHIEQINSYIKTGSGDLRTLIKKLYPVWQTQELLGLLEWMRANSSKYHLSIIGFDIDQSKIKPEHRDKYMAENIKTYLNKKPGAKCAIWAHNFHISKTKIGDFTTMGYYLDKWFGNDYYAIAQLFGRGEISATKIDESKPDSKNRTLGAIPVSSIPEDLLESDLDKLSQKVFMIETKNLLSEQARNKQKIRSIGWGVLPSKIDMYTDDISVTKAFDAIIYCPKSSRSESLK